MRLTAMPIFRSRSTVTPGTLLIDLNCTECNIKLGNDGLQAVGMPALAENATTLDSMTIGSAVERQVPDRGLSRVRSYPDAPECRAHYRVGRRPLSHDALRHCV